MPPFCVIFGVDPREYGVDGKLVILASEDGSLRGIDLRNRTEVFQVNCGAPLNSCAAFGDAILFAGSETGEVSQWDIKNLSAPLKTVRREVTPIRDLQAASPNQVWVSTNDGLFFLWDFETNQALIDFTGTENELSLLMLEGPDYESVTSICISGNTAYSACRDGMIRKYCLS